MKLHRREFLGRAGLAGAAVALGSEMAGAFGAGESPELAVLRRRVARYAGRVTVRSDSVQELDVVCEIRDLRRFAADFGGLVPEGATARVSGNELHFEHRGRRVRVENVLRA